MAVPTNLSEPDPQGLHGSETKSELSCLAASNPFLMDSRNKTTTARHPPEAFFTSWMNHVRPDRDCSMVELHRLCTP